MKLFLSLILVLVALLACYGEVIYLSLRPPHPGEILYLTVRSQRHFNFDQEKAFGSKRHVAIAQYTPLYSYVPDKAEASRRRMQDLINRVSAFRPDEKRDGAELEEYLRREFGTQVDMDGATKILQYPGFKNLLEAILAIAESILQNRIVDDPNPLKGKETVEVLFARSLGPLALPATEVVSLEDVRDLLKNRISKIFWQVDKSILDPMIQIALAAVTPNLEYNQEENDRRIEEIIQRYPSKTVHFKAGEVLVPFRKILSEEDVLLISAHQEMERRVAHGSVSWILFAVIFLVVTYYLVMTRVLQPWYRNGTPLLLHLSVLIIAIITMKLLLLFTAFPIFVLPAALIPMLLVLLYPEKVAVILTTMLGVLLITFFAGRTFQSLLFFSFGAIAAILATPVIRKRSKVLWPSLIVGGTNVVVALFALLDGNTVAASGGDVNAASMHLISDIMDMGLFHHLEWAFAGGFISGPLALVLLPFFERIWNMASTFSLFKYVELEHSLMKELLIKAPGTYQHSMTVAHFAQVAGEAINANTLLVRVGAYYHDIGKMIGSRHFVENQFGGQNPHDNLSPEESTGIIIAHIENGLRLGKEAGLPQAILDFISQHHGTQILEYFCDKARKSGENNQVGEPDFRYSGPKPQNVETAILMITDAVEAASRTLHEPTREKLDAMVRQIIQTRIAGGQFDECSLSTKDIAKIRAALTDSLAASFHTRVEYPWQKAEEQVSSGQPGN